LAIQKLTVPHQLLEIKMEICHTVINYVLQRIEGQKVRANDMFKGTQLEGATHQELMEV